MKTFEIFTPLSKKEVGLILKNLTNQNSDSCKFIGIVMEDSFSIMKTQLFANNVLNPLIKATLIEHKDRTVISAKATLNKNDKIGFAVMSIVVCCIIIFLTINAISLKSMEPVLVIIAVLCFEIIIAIIFSLLFYIKLRKTIKALRNELSVK